MTLNNPIIAVLIANQNYIRALNGLLRGLYSHYKYHVPPTLFHPGLGCRV